MLAEMIMTCKLRVENNGNLLRPFFLEVTPILKDFERIAGREFYDSFTLIKKKKGEFLLKEGEISKSVWYLKEGIARFYSCKNDVEITNDFFFESEFIDVWDSSTLKVPSYFNIQLLADSVLYDINWERIHLLSQKYGILNELEKLLVATYVRNMYKRIFDLQHMTATEKYRELIKNHPYILDLVPLTQVASYLGIKLETLSRIRAKEK